MLKITFVVCCLLAVAVASQSIAPLEPIPAKFKNQKGCYIKDLDLVLPLGEKLPFKNQCAQYRCGEQYVYIYGCSAVAPGPNCKIVEDKTKPYPGCCPDIKC